MDWRFERGGFTEDEIRNNLKRLGDDTTDEQIKQVHAMQQAQVGQWLMTKLKENFRATATITDAKWRKIEGRVIFVHDRLTNDEVQGMFTNCLDWDDDDAASEMAEKAETLTKKNSPREAFARMLPMLPADRAVKKLGHVTEPVAADVYLLSEVMVEEVE
jgi:hypothetical protein